ncbi:MAG: SprT-like domain-containing protein [Hungatella sp.]
METVKPMEAVTSYPEASRYLEELFDQANAHYFDQELPKVVLTIQSSPRSYGHFTPDDRWHVEFDGKKEINIGAGTLDRSIKNVMATLIHEMTHYYCNLHGIKDTSRSHTYHNKSFKKEAEKRGLLISHHDKYGWTLTQPSAELEEWIEEMGFPDILIARNEGAETGGKQTGTDGDGSGGLRGDEGDTPKKKRSSTRKYECPMCLCSVRATSEVRILCMNCNRQMVVADRDPT